MMQTDGAVCREAKNISISKKKKAKSGAKLQFYKDSSGTKSYFEGRIISLFDYSYQGKEGRTLLLL